MEERRGYAVGYIIMSLAVALFGLFMDSSILIVVAIALVCLTGLICRTRKRFYLVILSCYFILDQLSFSIGGSTFKAYFIFSIAVFCLSFYYWNAVFESNVLTMLTIWLIFGVVACLFSSGGQQAARTFFGVLLQALTAYTIYFLLISKTISLDDLEEFFYKIIMLCLLFGVLQLLVYRFAGVSIGLNASTASGQLEIGQIPSFRYEGNAFGKLIGWGIVFSIPSIVQGAGYNVRKYRNLIILSLLVMILSVTRSAVYALAITFVVILLWYQLRGLNTRLSKWILAFLMFIIVLWLLINSGVISLGDYSLYKLQNLFMGVEQANQDGSAGFRLESIRQGFAVWTGSLKNFIFGVGYLQAKGDLSFRGGLSNADVGGCEIVIIAESFGIIGLLMYVGIFSCIVKKALHFFKYQDINTKYYIWIERMFFLSIYSIVVQAFSGYMLCAEFWMIFGVFGFLEYISKNGTESVEDI